MLSGCLSSVCCGQMRPYPGAAASGKSPPGGGHGGPESRRKGRGKSVGEGAED